MLIVFDLDDTLIDTSGCVTYHRLEKALEQMVAAGLALPCFSEGLALLRRLNERALSAKEALLEFVELLGANPQVLDVGLRCMYDYDDDHLPLFALQGALEILHLLRASHCLALVTRGKSSHQMQKLKKAGIDSSIFSKILISSEDEKKILYQRLLEEMSFSGEEVVVCGDRVHFDLKPAKQLGCKTVLMRWGRGLNATLPDSDVDYEISSLLEFKEIVQRLDLLSSFQS